MEPCCNEHVLLGSRTDMRGMRRPLLPPRAAAWWRPAYAVSRTNTSNLLLCAKFCAFISEI